MSTVMFGGSRQLVSSSVLQAVVSSVLASGRSVSVGCALGADELALRQVMASGAASRLSVFAVGGVSASGVPAGFWRGSAVRAVLSAASAGASMAWWAGGAVSWPLRVRLFARSQACASSVLRGGPGGGAVFFVCGGPSVSHGSWAVARWCVGAGVPVVVFPVSEGFAWPGAPWAGVAGRFVPLPGSGVWSLGSRWVPCGRPVAAVQASWGAGAVM